MRITVLMVDDHPPIIEGYKSILSFNPYGYDVNTVTAFSCEMAYTIITTTSTPFNVVFLDITLPPYPEKKINSGEDLVAIVREYLPNAKIIILTSHTESIVLHRLVAQLKPEGLLVKSEVLSEDFNIAFDTVIKGGSYYSATVSSLKLQSDGNAKTLDSYNTQIIEMLSKGIKTKTIQEQLHLSKSAVDKRKVAIKDYLGIDKGNDEDILREARKQGLI
jgi:DNA-binding NarL/FixJ family response regulator